jgi:hypothetical protein
MKASGSFVQAAQMASKGVFHRSLANLEGLIGQLFPATLIARLVTLEFQFKKRKSD